MLQRNLLHGNLLFSILLIAIFLFFHLLMYFLCIDVLLAYMSVYHIYVCHTWKPQENICSLENGATYISEQLCGC